jgi:hypothetical protein
LKQSDRPCLFRRRLIVRSIVMAIFEIYRKVANMNVNDIIVFMNIVKKNEMTG